jgi:diacylglycerol kinase family enzyme
LSGRSYLFLVNEKARGGDAVGRLQQLLEREPLKGAAVRVMSFADEDGLQRGLEALTQDQVPVAVGGDGTVTAVARRLRAGARGPLGILPLGTGNGVAYSLGITSVSQAVRVLEEGVERPIDVMTTTHPQAPLSLLSVGVGLESRVMADFQAWRHRSRWLGAAVGCGRWALRRVSGVTVEADGERVIEPADRFYNVGLFNMPCYGFGVTPCPAADPADGRADLRVHRWGHGYWAYMGAAVVRCTSPLARTPDWPRVQRVTISTTMPLQIDGETVAPATVSIEVVPQGLSLLAPSL